MYQHEQFSQDGVLPVCAQPVTTLTGLVYQQPDVVPLF